MKSLAIKTKCIVVVACCMLLLAPIAMAIPYHGEETFTYHQPDGSTFQVKLYGDEFFAYQRTLEGYEVIKDPQSGFWCYARLDASGQAFESTGIPVVTASAKSIASNHALAVSAGAAPASQTLPIQTVLTRVQESQVEHRVDSKGRPLLPDGQLPATKAITGPYPSPPSRTTVGDFVGLCILVDFPDEPGTITPAQVDNYCNQPSGYTEFGNACSINEFFSIQSEGKFNFNNVVTAYVRMPLPKTYYDNDVDGTWGNSTAQELVETALDILIAQGFDFTPISRDTFGYIYSINVFYAGTCTSGWLRGLWPHSWAIPTKTVDATNNIKANRYEMTDMKTQLSIGTFCHENGHLTCLYPDLYSYVNNSDIVSFYSLMCVGNYGGGGKHPTDIDPYLKMKSGWSEVVEVDSTTHVRAVVQEDRNYFYKYTNPANSQEYFLIENRNNAGYEGPYGGHLASVTPGLGLVVWHVFEGGSNTYCSIQQSGTYGTPYEALVVEATPTSSFSPWYANPSPSPDSTDTFHATQGADPLSDATSPELHFWDHTTDTGRTVSSGMVLHDYDAAGPALSFIIGSGSPPATPAIGLTVSTLSPMCDLGSSPPNEVFNVFNAGGGTLNYTITDDASWLTCFPTSGSLTVSPEAITVTIDASVLGSGQHTATITITDAGASNSPQTIPVVLTVDQAPVLSALPLAINENLWPGQISNAHYISISNPGGGTMNYTVSESAPWLTLAATSGNCSNETDLIYLAIDATGLSAGNYSEMVLVAAPGATNSPQSVNVTLIVNEGILLFAPNGGEYLKTNTSHNVDWGCNVGPNVRIDLLKGGILDRVIVDNTVNDGSYEWLVPDDVVQDSDYRVRISTTDELYSDESDADFWILDFAGTQTALQWTWMKGSATANQGGTYGTLGMPDPSNAPGARRDSVSWSDAAGALWLFGGYGYDSAGNLGYLNDLWKQDPVTGNWTWMKGSATANQGGTYGTLGVSDPGSAPGARRAPVSWSDTVGALWLFGGYGYDSAGNLGYLNDLWKYDPVTGNWTWVKGASTVNEWGIYGTVGVSNPANNPGGRYRAVSWTDRSDALWLFGGYGLGAASGFQLNDLWNYDPATGNWTWIKGSSTGNQLGTYGTLGVAAPVNTPGSRYSAVSWTDSSGALWLFGGWGYSTGNEGYLNDLWKYVPVTGNWTWMKGASTTNQWGTYGELGVPDPTNTPGARRDPVSWSDAAGAQWLFGGVGYDDPGDLGYLNDLWKYDPATGSWIWTKGSSSVNQNGTYGTLGIAALDNTPGARDGATSWTDASGAAWMFGGYGRDKFGNFGYLNDLWKWDESPVPTFTVTFETDGTPGATLTGTTPQAVAHGDSCTEVTANAPASHHFAKWTEYGADYSIDNPLTVANVTADMTLTAVFTINQYTLTYTAGPNGSITGTTPQTVNHGADGSLVEAVPDTGYHFVEWSDASTQNPRTDLNVTGDITVTASFAINQYTLTYTAGPNGSITGTTPQTVNHGADGSLVEAVPDTGYHFVGWSDASAQNPRTDLNVTGDITVTANFAIDQYTLTYTAGPNGSITGTTPQTVNHGADGSLVEAVPDTGYHFVGWSDASAQNPRTDLNVTGDITVTASFAINQYTLTYTAGPNGSITGTTPQTVDYGADGSAVEAVANGGYHFVQWSDASTQNPRTDTNVTGAITVTASFAINQYTLTYFAEPNGSIMGTTPQTVDYGADGSLVEAVANGGYHFVQWSDASTQNPRTDLNVTGAITVTASFAINQYTLTYTAGPNGSITGTTPQTVDYGADGSAVQAVGNGGYHFVQWSDASTQNPRTDTNVTADVNVTAAFSDMPNPPLVTGPASPTNNATPTWIWQSDGGYGTGYYRYGWSEGAWLSSDTTDTSYQPVSALPEGAHTLYVQERDVANYWSNSGSYTVTIDTTAPGISGVTVNPSTAGYGDTVTIGFTSSEPLASTPVVTVNGHPAVKTGGKAPEVYSFTYAIRPEAIDPLGAATVQISIVDAAGNPTVQSYPGMLTIVERALSVPSPTGVLLILLGATTMLAGLRVLRRR